MILRKEMAADIEATTEVTIAAFKNHPISNHTEQFIINTLRDADALTISLVAEIDGRVVGHIAFSPVIISDGTKDWYGWGRFFLLPDYQKQGMLWVIVAAVAMANGGQLERGRVGRTR